MRRLVIETATESLSLAYYNNGELVAGFDELIGRGHAERLIPEIAKLPDGGKALEIWVDNGPGSFTGVRIGIAAAKGLAIAWGARIAAFPCQALVAASMAAQYAEAARRPYLIVMDGGHGEWLITPVEGGVATASAISLPTDQAIAYDHLVVTGSRAREFVERRGTGTAYPLHPMARHAHLVAPQSIGGDVVPRYGRAPDATPMIPRTTPPR